MMAEQATLLESMPWHCLCSSARHHPARVDASGSACILFSDPLVATLAAAPPAPRWRPAIAGHQVYKRQAAYGHLASLAHDDLIDRDGYQRGQQTIWRTCRIDGAILQSVYPAGYLCLAHGSIILRLVFQSGGSALTSWQLLGALAGAIV